MSVLQNTEDKASAGPIPGVAVIIATYNRWPIVCDAVESALKQTYPNVEVVVTDDASDDHTADRLKEKYGDSIQVIALQERGEKSRARNRGVQAAGAEYVCMLDSDDILLPDALASRMKVFAEDPCFDGVVYGSTLYDDEVHSPQRKSYPEGDILHAYIHDMSLINNNAFLLSREHMLKFGMYRPELTNMEDRELIIRLASHLPFRYCGSPVQRVRRVDGSRAGSNYDKVLEQGRLMIEALKADDAVVRRLGNALGLIEYLHDKETATAFYRLGRYAEFRRHIHDMWRRHPGYMIRNFRFMKRFVLSFFKRQTEKE